MPTVEQSSSLDFLNGYTMQKVQSWQVNSLVVETIWFSLEKKNDVNVARALKLLKVTLENVDNRLQDRLFNVLFQVLIL